MRGRKLVLDAPAALQSIHDRHHDVADDQVGHVSGRQPHPLPAVRCREDVVVGTHQLLDEQPDVPVVVDDEDDGLVGIEGGVVVNRLELGLDVVLPCRRVNVFRSGLRGGRGDVTDGERHREACSLVQLAFDGDGASMKLHEGLGQRQTDARAAGMDAVGLVEPVEDVADVVLADTLARVGDLEGQLPGIAAAADGDGAVAGRIFQRVGATPSIRGCIG